MEKCGARGVEAQIKPIAYEVAELIGEISPLIEKHTALVCPACRSVCCADRHSRYDASDCLYLSALGVDQPQARPALTDSSQCRFIGNNGCSLERHRRPYRCTWFFCDSLLAHIIESSTAPEYRSFIRLLQDITERRTRMLEIAKSCHLDRKETKPESG
jgi:hypothetical protein